MRIAVIGSGAMGSLFAARLTAVSDVVMVGHWPEQMQTIAASGLTLTEMDSRRRHFPLSVTSQPAASPPADVAIILVKSYQTSQAAADAADILQPAGTAVTLQNGLGNSNLLAAALGAERVISGVTTQAALITAPGQVTHTGNGPTTLALSPATAVTTTLASLLNAAGIPTTLSENLAAMQWQKVAINAAINPLTALLNLTNGQLLQQPWTQAVMAAAAQETAVVANALGIPLSAAHIANQAAEVAAATTTNYSSMHQDIARGRPTEIEAICGEVVKHGRIHNLHTPINERLLLLVQDLENRSTRLSPQIVELLLTSHLPQ